MKSIVWDLDDVLNQFTREWFARQWKHERPETLLRFEDLRSNPPLPELGVTLDTYLQSLDRFERDVAPWIAPRPDLLEWFGRNGERFHNVVLTARPLTSTASAAVWVFTHFGRWVRGFHCAPSPRADDDSPRYDAGKVDVLRRLGSVDYFVDDSRANVDAAEAIGIRPLLFPQPWNPDAKPPPELLAELVP